MNAGVNPNVTSHLLFLVSCFSVSRTNEFMCVHIRTSMLVEFMTKVLKIEVTEDGEPLKQLCQVWDGNDKLSIISGPIQP